MIYILCCHISVKIRVQYDTLLTGKHTCHNLIAKNVRLVAQS